MLRPYVSPTCGLWSVELQRLDLPGALLANAPDAATHEQHTDDRERRPTVGPDERQRPRQPADDEDETQDDAAHETLPVEGAGMISSPPTGGIGRASRCVFGHVNGNS